MSLEFQFPVPPGMMCAIEMNKTVNQTVKRQRPPPNPGAVSRSSISIPKSTPQTHPSHEILKTKHLQYRRHSLGG
jgi:hypothetical protein